MSVTMPVNMMPAFRLNEAPWDAWARRAGAQESMKPQPPPTLHPQSRPCPLERLQTVLAHRLDAARDKARRRGHRRQRKALQGIDAGRADRDVAAEDCSLVDEVRAQQGGGENRTALDHQASDSAIPQDMQHGGKIETPGRRRDAQHLDAMPGKALRGLRVRIGAGEYPDRRGRGRPG